jgi:hypothetical protein
MSADLGRLSEKLAHSDMSYSVLELKYNLFLQIAHLLRH